MRMLSRASVFHLSGGGYLTGMTSSRLWDHMLLLALYHILNVPSLLTGQTIGEFKTDEDLKYARRGLRWPKRITVRDRGESVRDLAAIGITGEHIQETFDDALFRDQAHSTECESVVHDSGLNPRQPYVAVNVYYWGQSGDLPQRLMKRFAQLCDRLADRHDLQILFCPMVQQDEAAIRDCIGHMQAEASMLKYDYDYRLVRGVIAGALFCFTMKHHPIVFQWATVSRAWPSPWMITIVTKTEVRSDCLSLKTICCMTKRSLVRKLKQPWTAQLRIMPGSLAS